MLLFGNILASAFKHYKKQQRVNPVFQAKLIVTIIQSLFLLDILLLIHEFTSVKIYSTGNYKILALIIYVLILLGNYKYFTNERAFHYIEKFESKSLTERRMWAVVTGITPIIVFLLFFLILWLRHPV